MIFSKNRKDAVALLLTISRQDIATPSQIAARRNYRPKKLLNRQLFFLQGIPGVGPVLAARMIAKFGSLKAVTNATEDAFKKVEGIGKAKRIYGFIDAN